MTSIGLRNFVQMASEKLFNHQSGLWLLLGHILLSQKCFRLRNSEASEVDNHLEKIDSADLAKDTKSVAGFSPSHQFRIEQNVTRTEPVAARTVSKWQPPKSLFREEFFQDSGVLQRLKLQ